MFIIPKIYKEEISAIKAFNKILLPNDPRHYVRFIYAPGGEDGKLIFCNAKAVFIINTELNIPRGYYTLSKVGSDQALIPSPDVTPEQYEYPSIEDIIKDCSEIIDDFFEPYLKPSWALSSSHIKFCHLLSTTDQPYILDIEYFKMLPEAKYELFISRDGKGFPWASYFKNAMYEAVIMPISV